MNQNSNFDASAYVGIQSRQPPDAQRFPAAHAGWFLKRERLSRGLALNKVAAQLKIRERYLWAIEEGVDAEFPKASSFFSMVSAYAEFLEFDPDPLIEHYREIMPAMIEAQKNGPGNIIALWPMLSARARPIALATVVILCALAGAGLWFSGGPSSPDGSKLATVPAPGDLQILKKRDLARQQGENTVTTSSIPSAGKNTLGHGNVQIRTMNLTDAMKQGSKAAVPLSRTAIETELDAAVKNSGTQ